MVTCVFCGFTGSLTPEHVIPQWVRKVHPPGVGGVLATREDGPNNRQFETRQYKGKTYDLKVRAVCGTCNHGWMSDLENAAKPTLTGLILGHQVRLNAHARRVVAAWAVKTIIVAQAKDTKSRVPIAHYRHLLDEGTAPPGTTVWAGAVDPGPRLASLRHRDVRLSERHGSGVHDAYVGTLSIGQMVLQVLGHEGVEDITRALSPIARSVLRPIWPSPVPTTTWPPIARVDLDGLSALSDEMLSPGVLRIRARAQAA